jgi:hypothetical protein
MNSINVPYHNFVPLNNKLHNFVIIFTVQTTQMSIIYAVYTINIIKKLCRLLFNWCADCTVNINKIYTLSV